MGKERLRINGFSTLDAIGQPIQDDSHTNVDDKASVVHRLNVISDEKAKHTDGLRLGREELKKLENSLSEVEARRADIVNDQLESSFGKEGVTPKGLVHNVLTVEMKAHSVLQLTDNIAKLKTQISWHEKKLTNLRHEEGFLLGKLDDIVVTEACKLIKKNFDLVLHHFEKAENAFKEVVEGMAKSSNLGDDFPQTLIAHGVSEWAALAIGGRILRQLQKKDDLLEFLALMTKFGNDQNPFQRSWAVQNKNIFDKIQTLEG
ncbi:MAG: hypothetical protein V2J25_15040 [Desulfatiglans sp.]|jgi:hypothetical protein|nr:hypothetical protein [Desulfatiglans sp.]